MKFRLWFYGAFVAALVGYGWYVAAMPGESRPRDFAANTSERARVDRLALTIRALATDLGERRIDLPGTLERARDYLVTELDQRGVPRERIELEDVGPDGGNANNIVVRFGGPEHGPIVVVGAHYDSAPDTRGANDNGSGTAVLLELAGLLGAKPAAGSVRLVFFANEEQPYFQQPGMGSRYHAARSKARGERIVAMLSLETMGYYSEAPGSQRYPWPVGLLYPDRGNFLAFVGNLGSRALVRQAIGTFRRTTSFPSEGAALPETFPGVGWSDHWAFWQEGYPALMLTDTALYRDPNYHRPSDDGAAIDYFALARVTTGIEAIVRDLATAR